MSSEKHTYTVKIVQNQGGKGGSEGRVATMSNPTNEHFPKITVQSPKEFKGPAGPDGKSLDWTPEDLYVASVAVCYFTTFVSIAENSKLEYMAFEVSATGILDKVEGVGSMITEIHETPILTIKNPADKEKALRIMDKTEKNCLIANSMKTKVTATFDVRLP
jgi:organic hydroperoxide reductase OsmC/OhrA